MPTTVRLTFVEAATRYQRDTQLQHGRPPIGPRASHTRNRGWDQYTQARTVQSKDSQTDNASSTWGICIRVSDTVRITRRGKISITKGEESSYRVEVEGLTQIYRLLPPHIITRHACDNEAAVRAHKTIFNHAQKSTRKWARTDYRTALDRLHQAIQNRGSRIQVVHTHSHLEDTPTDDVDLQTRRNTLAAADTQADLAHTLPAMRLDASPREMFRVHNAYGPLEKNVGAATVSTLHLRCTNQLQKLKMEGRMTTHTSTAP